MASRETVLEQVARRIVPNQREREKMNRLADRLRGEVQKILTASGIHATVTLQGSFARDTWISGETDLDIFTRFAPAMDRSEWIEKVLPAIRKGLGRLKAIERYAEHPFLELHVDGIRVNIVPCYDVPKGQWKSATDRTPYHTEYMNSNLTNELRLQARLLKKFTKGIGVYGAEIKTGGFSGMLVDTLAVHYKSFADTIQQASSWTHGTRLEVGKPSSRLNTKKREKNPDLVVIDPVDPNRNLAAAVRPERLWSFVAAGRQFLEVPGTRYFFPPEYARQGRDRFSKRIESSGGDLVAIVFNHPVLVPDVLWGQLIKLERSLVEMMAREDFQIQRSTLWSDEQKQSTVLLETGGTVLSSVKRQRGPPVSKAEDSQSFLKRHLAARDTIRGPWIDGDRWMVEKRRPVSTISTLLKVSLRDDAYGLTVPNQIGKSLARSVRVLQGQEVLSMLGRDGFDKSLWGFLEAKPSWLRSNRS